MSDCRFTPERWRPVIGYEGLYEVSSRGQVRSLDHRVQDSRGQWRRFRGRILRQSMGSLLGHRKVNLCKQGRSERRSVHGLVAEAFLGRRPRGQQVRHLDGDPANNTASNLAYGTQSDNEADKVRHGRSNRGQRCGASKLTREDVRFARVASAFGVSDAELSTLLGVTPSGIHAARTRRTWKWLDA